MGVMGPKGVAGIINDVSEHFSTAYSVLHKDVRISVKLDSSDNIGSLAWHGMNPLLASMEDVPTHVRVSKGEKRSEESRVGKECVRPCRSGWSASIKKKKK